MKTEKKFALFSKIKEDFIDATDIEDLGNITLEFEINEDYSNEDELVVDVTIKWRETKEIYIQISIDEKGETTKVNFYEDVWEEWDSFSYKVSKLWQVIFINSLDN